MQELQAKYRRLILTVLPAVGALASIQALLTSPEVSITGICLLIFFVVFFIFRLIIFVRTK